MVRVTSRRASGIKSFAKSNMQIIKNKSWTRCEVEMTTGLKMMVGLDQRLSLSPFLLVMVMDRLTDEVGQ